MIKLTPSSDIIAKVGFVEFHNSHGNLVHGTYKVAEHDGTFSYAVVGLFTSWYSETEYQTALADLKVIDRELVIAEDVRLADEISTVDYEDGTF